MKNKFKELNLKLVPYIEKFKLFKICVNHLEKLGINIGKYFLSLYY